MLWASKAAMGEKSRPERENSIHMAMMEAMEEIGLVTGDAAETACVLQRCNGERTRSAD
jgi:hypothetical protein